MKIFIRPLYKEIFVNMTNKTAALHFNVKSGQHEENKTNIIKISIY